MTQARAITLNALSLYAVALVLAVAFAAQLVLRELPCPLCLLQRLQFATLAVGPILNVRFGPRPSHYALSLLAAVAGAACLDPPGAVAHPARRCRIRHRPVRLSLLYLGPDRLLAAIVLLAAILLFDRQFEDDARPRRPRPAHSRRRRSGS